MDLQSLVDRKLEPVGKSNNDIIYRCPQCEGADGSGHLYVDYNKGYYNCFKCSFRGRRIESLLKYLNVDIDYDYTKLYNEQSKELDDIIAPKKKKVSDKIVEYSTDLEVLTEYYNLHTKPLSQYALDYLTRRGLSIDMINILGIREGVNRYGETFTLKYQEMIGRDYSGRIMVPSLRKDGNISFYVGRDYTGEKPNKYMNCSTELAVASEDVWNLDKVDSNSVIICEGVFTAIAVNKALGKFISVATYGKSIAHRSSAENIRASSQGEKLINRRFDKYIVFYDKDALLSSLDTCDYLYDRGCSVNLVIIPPDLYGPKADAADMTIDEIRNCIQYSEPYSKFTRTMLLGG